MCGIRMGMCFAWERGWERNKNEVKVLSVFRLQPAYSYIGGNMPKRIGVFIKSPKSAMQGRAGIGVDEFGRFRARACDS